MSMIELEDVRAKVTAALDAVDEDAGASPVLRAVVQEFANKANKALDLGAGDRAWEAVVELEQAGDSAKAAAEADVECGARDDGVGSGCPPRDLHAEGRVRRGCRVTAT